MKFIKCTKCGKKVKEKNVRYLDGIPFGVECWKGAVEEKRTEGLEKWKLLNWQRTLIFVEMLKMKDLSKIKNQFKLDFIKSMIEQFEDKGFITKKQKAIIIGDGEINKFGYENLGWLNNKDWDNLFNIHKETKCKFSWDGFLKRGN